MPCRLFVCCSLFLVLTLVTIPSHAVPITIDSALRSVAASLNFSPGTEQQSSSLGLFSETVNDGFVSPLLEISSQGSQISNISLSENTLMLNVAATAITNIAPTDISGGGSSFASASSSFSVQFTLDNWAAYDAHSFVSPVDSHISFAFYSLSEPNSFVPILGFVPFSVSGPYVENRNGLLAPGTYRYRLDTFVNVHPPHYGTVSSSAFSSFTLSMVPEPPALVFIALGMVAVILATRKQVLAIEV